MDVRCSHCGTDYEFDDALISEKGTLVQCTNCGDKFKVFPIEVGSAGPERWVVRTVLGRELVYTSLRELQRGIAERQIGPEDTLTRGRQPPRRLATIAELEPFFLSSARQRLDSRPAPPVSPPLIQRETSDPPPRSPPAIGLSPREIPDVQAPEANLEAAIRSATIRSAGNTVPSPSSDWSAPPPNIPQSAPVPQEASDVPTARESLASYDEYETELQVPEGRRARSRWIAGVVLLAILGLFGATIGRRYLHRFVATNAENRGSNPKIAALIRQSQVLSETGDYEGAREQLTKASTLAERDPAVLFALTRLEALRADLAWLRVQLHKDGPTPARQAAERDFNFRLEKARHAAGDSEGLATSEIANLRAKIDLLRLSGNDAQARALLEPIAAQPSQPDNAYVLAALDLADARPVWSAVIDRLRTAALAEKEPGRATVALIYALCQAGRQNDAEAELTRLENLPKPLPIIADLRGFLLQKTAPKTASSAGTETPAPGSVRASALVPAPDATGIGDFRAYLSEGRSALGNGDVTRAERLFQLALSAQPNNTEALAGMGEVALRRRDNERAARYFDQVLEQNPHYLPAQMARANQKWDSGDHAGAATLYQRIIDEAGPGSEYRSKAQNRLNQLQSAPKKRVLPPETRDPQPSNPAPEIDTTDLPGFRK